jgi:mono/diheme cytochrome c family protein
MAHNNKALKFRITGILVLLTILSSQVIAGNWDVPADKKAKNSNLKFDQNTAKEGEVIYTKNCASCHGNPSKGNVLKSLKPIPPDLASSGTQKLTDGELFYILNTGRGLMPVFKDVLSESDRWKVISYLRSFNKSYVQVLSNVDPSKSDKVKVSMQYDAKSNQVRVLVTAKEQTGNKPMKDAEVLLFAKRYFGKLPIEKGLRTNENGLVLFNYPKDLPGDKLGDVVLIVKVNDDVYGEIESSSKFRIGVPTDKPSLTAQRAIWNVLAKAPYWIIIIYLFGVITFGIFVLYLLKNLYDFWKIGKH